MKVVDITVNKGDVLNEVAKTTAYSGAKMTGEEGAYERIFTSRTGRCLNASGRNARCLYARP